MGRSRRCLRGTDFGYRQFDGAYGAFQLVGRNAEWRHQDDGVEDWAREQAMPAGGNADLHTGAHGGIERLAAGAAEFNAGD